ncbi:helix-turn-helix transcriptional regulator [Actinomycetospora endophytica]|uniref:Helix-turn-helix transcriptional regulator n=1 Tax=Actinomycetospora endophytica TaxID=2291215 RepID=A0ABS8PAZ9_9PSEU|nr:helix-turn-helix transcriptional regulator [Actinomycetospora endophytica]MCD2195208.1 helix-turn-helix transcriptional regulator [Actinomycetospora endophytica]
MSTVLVAVRRAVTLIDELADLDDPAGFADLALPGLASLIGADVSTYNEIGPGGVDYADHPAGSLPPGTRTVFAAHVDDHPLVAHYRATGDGRALRIGDFLTRREFHRRALYNEFFRHVPTEHQLAITVATPGTRLLGIALSRGRHEFSDTERDLLTLLRAPLAAGLARARARHDARGLLATTADATLAELTDREIEVLHLVALGRTNVAIAHALDRSPRTVAKHLERIYRKLGVHNRAAAVAGPAAGGVPEPVP